MVTKLATAIALRSASNVLMRNVTISGFNKGIEAFDSNLLLSGVNVQRCGVGLDLISSSARAKALKASMMLL